MGLAVKVFGFHTWRVMYTMGYEYDQKPSKPAIEHFLFMLGMLLPCSYCRVSFRLYLVSRVDLHHILEHEGGVRLIHNIHCFVNNKLNKQELPFHRVEVFDVSHEGFWTSFLNIITYMFGDNRNPQYIMQFLGIWLAVCRRRAWRRDSPMCRIFTSIMDNATITSNQDIQTLIGTLVNAYS
jgi:hypothetical protein